MIPDDSAAPPTEKDGPAQLDARASEAAETEQQVLAEAIDASDSNGTGVAGVAPGGALAGNTAVPAPAKMETITLGQTIAQSLP